jgi:hypothetical protein
MFYLVAGHIILIESSDECAHRAVSDVFSGWFFNLIPPDINPNAEATIRIHSTAGLPSVPSDLPGFEITCDGTCFTDEKSYYLKFQDALVVFGDGSADVNFWITETYDRASATFAQLLSQALSPALRRAGVFEIHSGGVIPPASTTAIMVAGPSGSGKSTLVTQLAKLGWAYLSDDILLLTEFAEEVRLQALRRFFALTPDTLAAVGLSSVKGASVTDLKHRLYPQDHFPSNPMEQSQPGAIVFPTVSGQSQSHLKLLTPAETMSRLLRLCPWASYDKGTSLEHLRMLGRLANGTRAFALSAGTDILNDSNLTAQIFFSITRKAFSAY